MSGAAELLKTIASIRSAWKGFNAARGDRNLTRLMGERSERLAQSDVEALRRDVQYWQLLANDNLKHRYPLSGELPVPKFDRSKLDESFQLKMSKKIRARFVNAAMGAVLGDPKAAAAAAPPEQPRKGE